MEWLLTLGEHRLDETEIVDASSDVYRTVSALRPRPKKKSTSARCKTWEALIRCHSMAWDDASAFPSTHHERTKEPHEVGGARDEEISFRLRECVYIETLGSHPKNENGNSRQPQVIRQSQSSDPAIPCRPILLPPVPSREARIESLPSGPSQRLWGAVLAPANCLFLAAQSQGFW
ncbi:hypothetical protein S40293_11021 [Stachybotrys chartarum IBT 40293]|nr:hypothetical protein S40293_11021 [Stachybotrys chartarum IBT 40293]